MGIKKTNGHIFLKLAQVKTNNLESKWDNSDPTLPYTTPTATQPHPTHTPTLPFPYPTPILSYTTPTPTIPYSTPPLPIPYPIPLPYKHDKLSF